MVGRIAVEQALRSVVVPDELLKVLVLNDHSGQTAVGLLNEREIRPQIVGLIAEAGEGGGVALADDLVKPRRPLDRCGPLAPQGQPRAVKVLPRVQYVPQGAHEQVRLLPHTAVQIGQQAVEVVIDLKVVAGILMEQHPASSAEDLNIPLIVEGKPPDHLLPERLLAAHPAHKAVQEPSPPSSGRRVWAVSNTSSDRVSPRIAAAMPPIRWVRWAMVARTSCSVAA